MAPEMNGWAAAIILMWPLWWMKRSPYLPLRLAVSNTARCSSRRYGAPSMVCRPQMMSLAERMSSIEKPSSRNMSKSNDVYCASLKPSRCMVSSPSTNTLKACFSSNTPGSVSSILRRSSGVSPFEVRLARFTPGAPSSVIVPTT